MHINAKDIWYINRSDETVGVSELLAKADAFDSIIASYHIDHFTSLLIMEKLDRDIQDQTRENVPDFFILESKTTPHENNGNPYKAAIYLETDGDIEAMMGVCEKPFTIAQTRMMPGKNAHAIFNMAALIIKSLSDIKQQEKE